MGNKRRGPKMDFAQIAFAVAQIATGEPPIPPQESPNVKRARAGGLKGGTARAKSLTKEQRAEIAKVAAAARWKKTSD